MDISGLYYDWENVEAINVNGCSGTIGQARGENEDWVEVCMWYDAERKLMRTLSVYTCDPDGLDLEALASQL